MAESVLRGLAGEGDIYECAYVESKIFDVGPLSCGRMLTLDQGCGMLWPSAKAHRPAHPQP